MPQPGGPGTSVGSPTVIRTIRTASSAVGGGGLAGNVVGLAGKPSVIVVQKAGPALLPGQRLAAATSSRSGSVALYRPTRAMLAAAAANGGQRIMLDSSGAGGPGSSSAGSVVRLAQTRPVVPLRPQQTPVILLDLSQTGEQSAGGAGGSESLVNFLSVSSAPATSGAVDTSGNHTTLQRIGIYVIFCFMLCSLWVR